VSSVAEAVQRESAISRPAPADALLMAVGVIAVATSGPLMVAAVAPALAIAFWRTALGASATAPIMAVRRRAELRTMSRRQWQLTVGAGALLAAHFAAWVPSLTLTSVASATALVCLQPVWTALIARWRGFEVTGRAWLGIAISVAGAVLLTGLDLSVSGDALLGDGLALVGGMFSAAYVVLGEEVRKSLGTTTYTTLCYGTSAIVLLGACLVSNSTLVGYDARTWWILVAVTVGPQLLGHSVFNRVLRSVSSTVVALVILFEIPGAALIAWVWLDQTPPALAVPAIALLLGGLVLVVGSRSRGTAPSIPAE
jgi:drug/metabolite transporter (DMT)-like permease